MRLVDLALTLVTLAVGATMVLTYFVPYVDPGRVWFFPVLGLAAPAVYVASVVLTLYWIIRWRWVCAAWPRSAPSSGGCPRWRRLGARR